MIRPLGTRGERVLGKRRHRQRGASSEGQGTQAPAQLQAPHRAAAPQEAVARAAPPHVPRPQRPLYPLSTRPTPRLGRCRPSPQPTTRHGGQTSRGPRGACRSPLPPANRFRRRMSGDRPRPAPTGVRGLTSMPTEQTYADPRGDRPPPEQPFPRLLLPRTSAGEGAGPPRKPSKKHFRGRIAGCGRGWTGGCFRRR